MAFVVDQVRVEAEFHATLAGKAVSFTDGAGGGGGAEVEPPLLQAVSVRDATTRRAVVIRWCMAGIQYLSTDAWMATPELSGMSSGIRHRIPGIRPYRRPYRRTGALGFAPIQVFM